MGKIYITIEGGEVVSCYGDTKIDVAIIDLNVQSLQHLENNDEMLSRLEDAELIELELQ